MHPIKNIDERRLKKMGVLELEEHKRKKLIFLSLFLVLMLLTFYGISLVWNHKAGSVKFLASILIVFPLMIFVLMAGVYANLKKIQKRIRYLKQKKS